MYPPSLYIKMPPELFIRWPSESRGQIRWWVTQGDIILIDPSWTHAGRLLLEKLQSHDFSHVSHSLLFFVQRDKSLTALFLTPSGSLVDVQFNIGMFFCHSNAQLAYSTACRCSLSLYLLDFTSPAGPLVSHAATLQRGCTHRRIVSGMRSQSLWKSLGNQLAKRLIKNMRGWIVKSEEQQHVPSQSPLALL